MCSAASTPPVFSVSTTRAGIKRRPSNRLFNLYLAAFPAEDPAEDAAFEKKFEEFKKSRVLKRRRKRKLKSSSPFPLARYRGKVFPPSTVVENSKGDPSFEPPSFWFRHFNGVVPGRFIHRLRRPEF